MSCQLTVFLRSSLPEPLVLCCRLCSLSGRGIEATLQSYGDIVQSNPCSNDGLKLMGEVDLDVSGPGGSRLSWKFTNAESSKMMGSAVAGFVFNSR
jgi:hypothetical protein